MTTHQQGSLQLSAPPVPRELTTHQQGSLQLSAPPVPRELSEAGEEDSGFEDVPRYGESVQEAFQERRDSIAEDVREFYRDAEEHAVNLHTLIQEYERGEMYIKDTITLFEERLQDFQTLEFKTVVQEKRSVNNTILQDLEREIESIERSVEKICSSQFQKNIEYNEGYKREIVEDTKILLGFEIATYNRMSMQIERVAKTMSKEIQAEVRKMCEMIHEIEILERKLTFLGNVEKMEMEMETGSGSGSRAGSGEIEKKDRDGIDRFQDLVDMYEREVKHNFKEKILGEMKTCADKIHRNFSVMKYMHENLYQKIYSQYTCGICMNHDIDIYYQACGHVICKVCATKSRQPNLCPYCKRESPIKNLFLI